MFNSHAYHSGTDPSFGYALGASAKPLSADGSQGQKDGDPCTTSDGSEGEWHGETCVPIKGIVEVDVDSGAADVVVDTGLGKLIENVDASKGDKGPKLGDGIPSDLRFLVLEGAKRGKCGDVFRQIAALSGKKKIRNGGQVSDPDLIGRTLDSVKSFAIDPKKVPAHAHAVNAGGKIYFKDNYNTDPRGPIGAASRFVIASLQEMIHQIVNDDELEKVGQRLYDSGSLDSEVRKKINSKSGTAGGHDIIAAACATSDLEIIGEINAGLELFFANGNPVRLTWMELP